MLDKGNSETYPGIVCAYWWLRSADQVCLLFLVRFSGSLYELAVGHNDGYIQDIDALTQN